MSQKEQPGDELAQDDSGNDAGNGSTSSRRRMTTLPISRVSYIMRQCPNTTTVKGDAVGLMAKAAEMFLLELVKNTFEVNQQQGRNLSVFRYQDLAEYLSESDYNFLKDIIPPKITYQQYKNIQASKQPISIESDDDDDDDT